MKKTTIAILTSFLLIGCGGDSNSSDTQNEPSNADLAQTNNGSLSYKNLEWQDNKAVAGEGSEYAYRNDYCSSLTLGEHTDWRLPTVKEFKELYSIKNKVDYVWQTNDLDLYWTADGTDTTISVYNFNNGIAGLFYVDKVGSYKWGIRCLRTK